MGRRVKVSGRQSVSQNAEERFREGEGRAARVHRPRKSLGLSSGGGWRSGRFSRRGAPASIFEMRSRLRDEESRLNQRSPTPGMATRSLHEAREASGRASGHSRRPRIDGRCEPSGRISAATLAIWGVRLTHSRRRGAASQYPLDVCDVGFVRRGKMARGRIEGLNLRISTDMFVDAAEPGVLFQRVWVELE